MGSTELPRKRRSPRTKFTSVGDHNKFLSRIKKSLYYGQLPKTERLSLPVTEVATEHFSSAQRKRSLQRLELQEASDLSRSACVSPCSLVLALLYMERLQSSRPSYLRETTPSELYLVSLMVATKFLQDDGEDDCVVNEEWAISAGISTSHLNQLERDFLDAIEWEIYVSEEAFWTRLRGLERDVALNEGVRRGWFSYADLDCLLDKVDFAALAHSILTVSAVCLTSYTASVLTLIASTILVSQIQPLMSSLNSIGSSGASSLNSPLSSIDQTVPHADDPTFPPSYQSPVDVLTTSFILASISSVGERLGNDSVNCSDKEKANEDTISHPLLGIIRDLPQIDHFEPVMLENMDWNNAQPYSWIKWLKELNGWFRTPLLGSLEYPPDWATTLSHCIDRSASTSQSRLLPLQVY